MTPPDPRPAVTAPPEPPDSGSTRPEPGPIRPTDDEARALARALIDGARFAALGTLTPATGIPLVTRIGIGTDAAGDPVALVSGLAAHSKALLSDPHAGLMLGEPEAKGDPLAHPRLSLATRAVFIPRQSLDHDALRARWLVTHPKAKLYVDFTDFGFVRFEILSAALNGGFGRAFELLPEDLSR